MRRNRNPRAACARNRIGSSEPLAACARHRIGTPPGPRAARHRNPSRAARHLPRHHQFVITIERRMGDWASTHRLWEKWASNNIGSSGEPLKAALLLNYDPTGPSRLLSIIAEQEGIKLKAVDLLPFLEFVKQKNWQMEFFSLGQNQYLVTSIHEHWFCARCVNTSKPGGEGVIVMQTGTFLLVAMYEGSLGSASQAMVAVDQLAWQMSRRTH